MYLFQSEGYKTFEGAAKKMARFEHATRINEKESAKYFIACQYSPKANGMRYFPVVLYAPGLNIPYLCSNGITVLGN